MFPKEQYDRSSHTNTIAASLEKYDKSIIKEITEKIHRIQIINTFEKLHFVRVIILSR